MLVNLHHGAIGECTRKAIAFRVEFKMQQESTRRNISMQIANDEFRTVLERKRRDLVSSIRSHARLMIIGQDDKDLVDQVQGFSSRDEAGTVLDKLTNTLSSVERALRSLSEASYGICAECGETISKRRLEAIPWAACCISCQQAAERDCPEQRSSPVFLDERADAA